MNLHLYAQFVNHEPAYILGNRKAIILLIESLERTLIEKKPISIPFYTSDGEEYDLIVSEIDNKTFFQLNLPYTNKEFLGLDQCNLGTSPAKYIKTKQV